MSGTKAHLLIGQMAIIAAVIMVAIIAFLLLNWDLIQPERMLSSGLIPADFSSQLIMIFAIMIIILVVYAVYQSRKPKMGHLPMPA